MAKFSVPDESTVIFGDTQIPYSAVWYRCKEASMPKPACISSAEVLGLAAKYGLSDVREGLSIIRDSVWSCFVQKVQL